MNRFGKAITGAVMAATLGSATAASAQYYPYRGPYYRHWGGYRGGDAFGGFLAGAAVVGVIAALASSSRRSRGYDDRGVRDAAGQCASFAEQRFGAAARAHVDEVRRWGDGYQVRGWVEAGYSGSYDRDRDGFNCSVRYGRVDDLRFDRG